MINCKAEKYTRLSSGELERYSRQIMLEELGTAGQLKLKNGSVLVVGAGGLGSPAVLYLAGAGVGRIGIIDADEVSVSNLQRQIAHCTENSGVNKAVSAGQAVLRLNENVTAEIHQCMLTPENAEKYISEYDFILDCCDSFKTKFLINDTCVRLGIPFCHAGILEFGGQVMTWIPGGDFPCYRCVFEDVPEDGDVPKGIIGAVAGIAGTVQALEAVKYLTGAGELLAGKLFTFDGLTMKTRTVRFSSRNPECGACGSGPQDSI